MCVHMIRLINAVEFLNIHTREARFWMNWKLRFFFVFLVKIELMILNRQLNKTFTRGSENMFIAAVY